MCLKRKIPTTFALCSVCENNKVYRNKVIIYLDCSISAARGQEPVSRAELDAPHTALVTSADKQLPSARGAWETVFPLQENCDLLSDFGI